jgi:hypothetical protein
MTENVAVRPALILRRFIVVTMAGLIMFYFMISGEGWDRTRNLLSPRLIH